MDFKIGGIYFDEKTCWYFVIIHTTTDVISRYLLLNVEFSDDSVSNEYLLKLLNDQLNCGYFNQLFFEDCSINFLHTITDGYLGQILEEQLYELQSQWNHYRRK